MAATTMESSSAITSRGAHEEHGLGSSSGTSNHAKSSHNHATTTPTGAVGEGVNQNGIQEHHQTPSSTSHEIDAGPSPSSPLAVNVPMFLAKIYRLVDNDREWQDCGVVRVRSAFVDRLNAMALVLVSDEDPRTVILEVSVAEHDYRRDVATIISWGDLQQFPPGAETIDANGLPAHNVALSFETSEGCSKIWEDICAVKGRIASDYRLEGGHHGGDMYDDGVGISFESSLLSNTSEESGYGSSLSASLPVLARENLETIVQTLRGAGPLLRARFGAELINEDARNGGNEKITLTGILALFDEIDKCVEESDEDRRKKDLALMFELIKSIALLDNQQIFEIMLSDSCFERVVGALENDPIMPFQPDHRKFLRDEARFNQVVPITNEKVQAMITQRFRLGFLRDVLLPRVLDEQSFKRLNTMDIRLSAEIATLLHQDEEFMSKLFTVLHGSASVERTKAVAFLAELAGLSQKMQAQARNAFFRTLMEGKRLLRVCEHVLGDPNSTCKERLDVGEIVLLTLKHDTMIIRDRIIECENGGPSSSSNSRSSSPRAPTPIVGGTDSSSSPSILTNGGGLLHHQYSGSRYASPNTSTPAPPNSMSLTLSTTSPRNTKKVSCSTPSLMGLLVDCLVQDEDAGVQAQAGQLLEILLDPESIVSNHKEDDPFIGIFYAKYFNTLCSALDKVAQQDARRLFNDPETPVYAAHLICALVSFCVQTHGYVVREVIAKHVVVPKVLKLLECREKHLLLDAIRFVRTCIGMKEKFYNDYFIQNNLLSPIFRAFAKNGAKNNLVNSTVIDLLEFIKTENVAPLVDHVVSNFRSELSPINAYVRTFIDLEQLHQANTTGGAIAKSPSTQSLNSSSSSAEILKRSAFAANGRHQRVTATRSTIFGDSRHYHDDDDEALFDDDLGAHSPVPPPASTLEADGNSPNKRSRIEAAVIGGDDLSHDFRVADD